MLRLPRLAFFSPIVLSAAALLGLAGSAPAEDFAPVTDAQRELTVLADYPEAPAVILFRRGKLDMMDLRGEQFSSFEVHVRIKILTEEGKSEGELELSHSRFYRLDELEARTIRPDGTVVPVAEDSIFEERSSRSEKTFLTKLTFPAVEVGAMLDYRYRVHWSSIYFLDPWVFEADLPTLRSEITYVIPVSYGFNRWWQQKSERTIQQDLQDAGRDRILRVWMENVAPLPDEPSAFPAAALTNRFLVVPRVYGYAGQEYPLLESWDDMAKVYEEGYSPFRRKSKKARKFFAPLLSSEPSPRAKIDKLHAWVRDEVRGLGGIGLAVEEKRDADEVFEERAGSNVEKALLLEALIDELVDDADLVWATSRWEDQPDLNVATPWWFDRVLVAVELDGETLYLDPDDDGLAAGRLRPDYEAMPALQVGARKVVQLPSTPVEDHTRRVHLRLEVDDEGRVSGVGTLKLAGHPAWARLGWKETDEETLEAWTEWLEDNFDGYTIDAVEVEENVAAQTLRLGWDLEQREEDVLGDEATIRPSLPYGPRSQLFTLETRKTPVLLNYASRTDLTLELTWPEGWALEVPPAEAEHESLAGVYRNQVEHDPAARSLRFDQRFEVRRGAFDAGPQYEALRNLYSQAEKADAQDIVLVAE